MLSIARAGIAILLVLKYCNTLNQYFYVRKQLLLSAHLSHRSSVSPSLSPSVTRVDQSKTVQARITKSLPSAAWKILVSETVKLSHIFRTRALNKRGWKKLRVLANKSPYLNNGAR